MWALKKDGAERESLLSLNVALCPCDSRRRPDRGQSQPAEDGREMNLGFNDIIDGLSLGLSYPMTSQRTGK